MAKESNQISLLDDFGVEENWKEHWKDMPEFKQDDLTSYKSIIVHFENEADYKKFSSLIGQKLTYKTRSIWFPEAEIGRMDKMYVDEGGTEK
jgi:hypothetical protein